MMAFRKQLDGGSEPSAHPNGLGGHAQLCPSLTNLALYVPCAAGLDNPYVCGFFLLTIWPHNVLSIANSLA